MSWIFNVFVLQQSFNHPSFITSEPSDTKPVARNKRKIHRTERKALYLNLNNIVDFIALLTAHGFS